jgi:hypothetical protein
VDILAKIQCPPSNDPNVRNAHVVSFFAIAKLNSLTPKSPMPLQNLEYLLLEQKKIIDNMLVLSFA